MTGVCAVFLFAILFGVFTTLVVPILAIVALVRTGRLTRQLAELKGEIGQLRAALSTAPDIGEVVTAPIEVSAPAAAVASRSPAPAPSPVPAPETAPQRPLRTRIEELLTVRGLIWFGAATVALAGAFLVKHAVDREWLTPATRVALGGLLGLLLVGVGDWLRRRPVAQMLPAVAPNSVSAALTASGLAVAFASAYAGYALYALIGPLPAFTALAAIAIAALALALLHGPFVALLGILGGFVTPLLVRSTEPSAITLFSYLLVITLSSLIVIRRRNWQSLAAVALLGAALWPLGWLLILFSQADVIPVGLYVVASFAALLILSPFTNGALSLISLLHGNDRAALGAAVFGWSTLCAAALLLFLLVGLSNHSFSALAILALWTSFCIGFGRSGADRESAAVLAAILTLGVFATWQLPGFVSTMEPLVRTDTLLESANLPPELGPFALAALFFGALFGIGGFVTIWGAPRPALWAGLSAGVPALLFVIAYWRLLDFGLDLRWATASLLLAAANLMAVYRVERYRAERGYGAVLGFYAAAVSLLLSLGMAMTLREAWLTVALSVQLPVLAWIWRKLQASAIRILAMAIAAVVLARLVLNYSLLEYPLHAGLLNWILYGYGIPALMFFWAARSFAQSGAHRLSELLRAGALLFSVLLVSLEIRVLTTGALNAPYSTLLEQSIQTLAWLTFAAGLNMGRELDRVRRYAVAALTAAAVLQIVFFHLWLSNPIYTHEPVGAWPVFNLLLLAYAVPAGLLFYLAGAAERYWTGRAGMALRILAFALIWLYLTLEVRRTFQGSVIAEDHLSDLEYYAYSMIWLAYAGLLLLLGIAFGRVTLRYASLAVLLVTVIKVFVGDMSDLTGLYRVASFLLLGLSLIGIGWLYQRFVFPLDRRPELAAHPS